MALQSENAETLCKEYGTIYNNLSLYNQAGNQSILTNCISSNGYYGFMPVKLIDNSTNYMEVEESRSVECAKSLFPVCKTSMPSESANFKTKLCIDVGLAISNRKRNISETVHEESKRLKLQAPFVIQKNEKLHAELSESNEEIELIELLLKETHGCELYNYKCFDE